jgi:hypothetical protein
MRNYGAKEQVKNGDYFSLGTYISSKKKRLGKITKTFLF